MVIEIISIAERVDADTSIDAYSEMIRSSQFESDKDVKWDDVLQAKASYLYNTWGII